MQKNMMLLVVLFTACMQAMEIDKPTSWSIAFGKTKINVNQENVFDVYADGNKKVDFVVVERFAKPKKHSPDRSANSYFSQNKDYNVCLDVKEYRVKVSPYGDMFYERFEPKHGLYQCKYYQTKNTQYNKNNDPIKEASKDLKACYREVLTKAAEKGTKSIALAALGTVSYRSYDPHNPDIVSLLYAHLNEKAVQVGIDTILEFIKDNPEAYDRIELHAGEDSLFDVYKNLIQKYAAEK